MLPRQVGELAAPAGTWEPPANLDGSNLISNWEKVKRELGEAAFRRENEENIAAYGRAQENAEAARESRHEKRERKRQRLRRQSRRAIAPDDDSSDEEPLRLAHARALGGESLFVEDPGVKVSASSSVGGPRARQPLVPRTAPFQQSSSEEDSDSDAQNHGDPSSGERQKKTDRDASSQSLASTILKPERLNKSRSPSKTSKTDTGTSSRDRESKVTGEEARGAKGSAVSDKPSTQQEQATDFSGAKDRSTAVSTTTSKPAGTPGSKPNAMRAIRTAPQKQTSRAINIIDHPVEQKRKPWSTDHHYNKIKFRGLAEKRSRAERTPDFNALDFVHGPPPTLPKSSTLASADNPYGRREISNHRVQEEDPEDRPRRGTAHDPAPLADWEADKVPQMCASWRLSRNCPYGPQKCRFMHRDLDPKGQEYPLGDIGGRVPFKYRNPPITCPFWYQGHCKRSPEQCIYAHEDTGWAEINGEPIRIHLLPEASIATDARNVPPHLLPFKLQDPPITCTYWLRNPHGCIKSEEVCKYAHWNTGWAPPENDLKGQPVQIDPNLRPLGVHPKHADPPVTCPFWLRGEKGCAKTDDECRYAHRNTGWAPPGLSAHQPEKVDPKALPRSQWSQTGQNPAAPTIDDGQDRTPASQKMLRDPQSRSDMAITCPSWLRDSNGCPKSEEDCEFQHRNTGWATPKNRPLDPPVPLDPNQIPRSVREGRKDMPKPKHAFQHAETKNGSPPTTCFFWLRHPEGCRFSAEACKYAHRNTGWLSQSGKGKTLHPEKIDPKEPPRFRGNNSKEVPNDRSEIPVPPPALSRAAIEPYSKMPDLTPGTGESAVAQTSEQELASALPTTQVVPPMQLPTATTSSQLNQQIEQYYNLDMIKMFGSGVTGDYILERRAMLLYHPEEHSEDIELITRWLLMHKVEVGNLWYDGAWGHFQQEVVERGRSGIIIVHPDFEQYTSLPGFGEVLNKQIRVWSVGLQPPSDFEPRASSIPPVLRHDCVVVFPHGGFIYITEDVFEKKPQLALGIVKLFFAKIEQLRSLDEPISPWYEVHDACLLWRLCVRPELMEYLFQKCEDNAAELAAGDLDYLSRAQLYQILTVTNYIEQDCSSEALSAVHDQYPILSERRVIAETQTIDYFKRLSNSREEATSRMIEYYATMQTYLRRDYRQFYVVHTEPEAPCAQQWRERVQTIAGVITPEQCVEELGKDSKESLFDFMDWAMRPKKEEQGNEEDAGHVPMEIETVEHTA
ncbi:hypothetical protein M3J09_000040 [Ascochyta lentis]